LSKEQIDEMIKKAEEFKEEDNKQKELIESKNGLENYLYNLKNSMTKRYDSPPILDEIKEELDPIIDEGLKWLEENDKGDVELYKNKQKELEEKVNPLMQKLYSQGMPGGMPDMSGGMPEGMSGMPEGMSGMPEGMSGESGPTIDEVD